VLAALILRLDWLGEVLGPTTGNQITADAGANPWELMARMGHDSPRAALIYLHSSDDQQRILAEAVGTAARSEQAGPASEGIPTAAAASLSTASTSSSHV
jgi:hypothetical protein